MSTPTQEMPASRLTVWHRLIAFHTLAALFFAMALEWRHYRDLTGWAKTPLAIHENVALLWLLAFKSWLLMLPVLAIGGALVWRDRTRAALRVAAIGWGALLLWLAVDLGAQRMLGAHLTHYAPYLVDVFRSGDSLTGGFGGDVPRMLLVATPLVLGALATGVLAWVASGFLQRRYLAAASGRRAVLSMAALLAVQLAGVVPAQALFGRTSILRRVHEALPTDVRATRELAARIGGLLESPPSVRIVTVVPAPRGKDGDQQVTVHNFAPHSIDLAGWSLRNRKGERHPLDGTLAPHESRTLGFKATEFQLHNSRDTVGLYDVAGALRHEVGWTSRAQTIGGQVIGFRDEEDFDAFSRDLNARLEPVARKLHPIVRRLPVLDDAPFVAPGTRPPDVLMVILESPQHTLLSPDALSRLDAWSRTGLRLDRHYAPSNVSHFGLHGLLYGRLPIFYDRDLDHDIPPQLVARFRRAGYHTVFLAMGFEGWRRMGETYNTRHFDEVMSMGKWKGRGHKDWIDVDREMFADVRRRLTEPHDKPQLLILFGQSTHFPYEFPPEFAIHEPSGMGVTWENWTKLATPELRNRFLNASLFLESEIMKTIEAADPAKTIVIFTGDHGESLGEDGGLSHGSKASEIQLRVPFAMVGPGIEPDVITTATSHLDVLPTLVHAIAGKPVPLAGAMGRDLLSGEPLEDRVLLAPREGEAPFELLLIDGGERLLFKMHLDRPGIQTFGFVDERGDMELDSPVPPSPERAARWIDALAQELERIPGPPPAEPVQAAKAP